MKFLPIGIALSMLIFSLPAKACLGPAEEYTIFFDRKLGLEDNYVLYKAPAQSQATVKVQIVSVKNNIKLAKVLQVPKNKELPIKIGSFITLDYKETSCTQTAAMDEIGTIAVRSFVNSDNRKELKAYIYQRRYRDGRIQ